MKTQAIFVSAIFVLSAFCPATGQHHAFVSASGPPAVGTSHIAWHSADSPPAMTSDNQDDPAYTMYKEGYNDVLDERWEDARAKFAAMLKKYPKSEFADDAQYWSAFALRHVNRKAAIEAYKKFVKAFPGSPYYDDAVADLNQLKEDVLVVTPGGAVSRISIGDDGSYRYVYSTDSNQAAARAMTDREMARLERAMRSHSAALGRITPMPPTSLTTPRLAPMAASTFWTHDEKIDPETQLKVDALHAIGDAKEDDRSFQALKEVALDYNAARILRLTAINMLSDFKKFDIMPIFMDIARRDTSEEMQNLALTYLSDNRKDKARTVQTLIDVFNSIPKEKKDQRRRIFFTIADIGGDRAIDFLATVARTNGDYEMRREAVFYLGSIGGEKARTVLYDILRGKTSSK